jgi:hypothetical protein
MKVLEGPCIRTPWPCVCIWRVVEQPFSPNSCIKHGICDSFWLVLFGTGMECE